MNCVDKNFRSFYPKRGQFELTRAKTQVRLASCRFIIRSLIYQTDSTQLCTLCNRNKNKTMQQILLRCTIYNPIWEHYFTPQFDRDGNVLENITSLRSLTDILKRCAYPRKASGEGTLLWAIFLFPIFSNYLSHKFGKNKNNSLNEW